MLRKILFIAALLAGFQGMAQQKQAAGTSAKKEDPAAKIDYTQIGAPMPNMILISLDSVNTSEKTKWHKIWHKSDKESSEVISTNLITNETFEDVKANILVMIFNPTCSHCANETDLLERNMELFKKSKLVMVCNPMLRNNLPDFVKQHSIKKYPNIYVGVDSNGFMGKTFQYHLLPQINVYDKNRKLVKIFSGDISLDSLKGYIQ